MGKKLFPKEIIDDSSEANFSKHSVHTKLIYITVLAAFVAIFIALPLIHVTVSVKSPGVVQPLTTRSQLVSLVSGHIEELHIEENATVVRGQTVATISDPVLQEQSKFNMQRQQKVNRYLSDLSVLLNLDESRIINPGSFNESNGNEDDANESDGNNDSTAPQTEVPSALLQFKDQMVQFRDQVLNAGQNMEEGTQQENVSSSTLKNTSDTDSNNALQKARTGLWKLLNIDTSYLLEPGQEDYNVYQQALTRFEQQISEPLQEVGKARDIHNRSQRLYERGMINDATHAQSRQNLQKAWNSLLAAIEETPLTGIGISAPEEKDISPGTANNNSPKPEELHLKTAKYRSSLIEFKQQARNNIQEIRMAQIKYNRNKQLYERDVISEEAYEESGFALENARNDFQLLFDQQRNRWQTDQITYQDESEQLNSDGEQINKEQDRHIIRAPISGTIQNMKGIYEGSQIVANQALAEISPDTSLIVECYVPPNDVGLLREGMEARFQISAYDYNQWGLLTGTIQEISNDVTIMNGQPVFLVRASLDQTWLELQNGYRGNLKKGMSLLARFNVTERSLFQLLYDNLDDWLNPEWDEPDQAPTVTQQQASASI